MDDPRSADSDAVNLLDLDLNLLVALDALLSTRSVTRAGESLHRSQPAVSASLKRLRRLFDDELLIRVGNRLEPTPLADQLKPRVAALLAHAERVLTTRARFDAEGSTREFVVYAADYGQVMLAQAMAEEMAAVAPQVRLWCRPVTNPLITGAAEALRTADGAIIAHGFLHDLPHLDLYVDRWVLMADRANPLFRHAVDLPMLAELDWVLPFQQRGAHAVPPVRQLELLGVELRVVVTVGGFLALPAFVAGTDRVTIIPEQLAHRIAPPDSFRIVELPFDVVPLTEAFWWHPSVERDPGHQWFRSIVAQAGQRLAAAADHPSILA